MDSEFLFRLGLDSITLSRDIEICRGIAQIYQGEYVETDSSIKRAQIAATYYRKAGADALLLGKYTVARSLFLKAAEIYDDLNLSYALLIASLAADFYPSQSVFYKIHNQETDQELSTQIAYHVLFFVSRPNVRDISYERILYYRNELESMRNRPIGVLGMPVSMIVDLIDALDPQIAFTKISIEEALLPILVLYNSAVRTSISRKFILRHLSTPFHLAEPDIFGLLLLVNKRIEFNRRRNLLSYIDNIGLASETNELLLTILQDMINL